MTSLAQLHVRLRRLLRRRRRVRRLMAAAAILLALLWAAAALFFVDWLFEMSPAQRLVALLLALGGVAWGIARYALPWLGRRESELDMALAVERQHGIDSELVAALQFERPEARGWGSPQLEGAVVDRAAALGSQLDVMQGFSRKPLARRAAVLAATLAVAALVALVLPGHLAAFLDRLLLGSAHYPSSTRIEAVRINGSAVPLAGGQVVKCPYGRPVRFAASCDGVLPRAGRAELRTPAGARTEVLLEQKVAPGEYTGVLDRLVDAVEYRFYVGDAWTDPSRIVVVPLPSVEVEITVTPPSYAGSSPVVSPPTGLRQLAVEEGSRVALAIVADKPLRSATVALEGQSLPLASAPASPRRWTLPVDGTPLAAVAAPLRYSIQVTDVDGLALERPLVGTIRVKPDHPPAITASLVTEYVLPAAKPTIAYEATDDRAISVITLITEIRRAAGAPSPPLENPVIDLSNFAPRLADRYVLDLAPHKLAKGDELHITLRATDDRGARPGKSAESDPLVLHVTDEQGILAAMAETDRESARQLETMIQRQIGVGGGP